jgi:integrase
MSAAQSSTTYVIARAGRRRSRRSGRFSQQAKTPSDLVFLNQGQRELAGIIQEFTDRYPNAKTAADARKMLAQLFRHAGKSDPADLTETDLLSWATHGSPANNTVYQRASKARTFLRWCLRSGYVTHNAADHLADPDSPLRTYHRTYGKVQAQNPGRWLTHDEAYVQLIGACQDGSEVGLRDELVIRLGLMGMRLAEIRNLTIGNLRQLPTITWTGKGHKPRQAHAGTALVSALTTYLKTYADNVPEMSPDLPLIVPQTCGATRHGAPARLNWGHAISDRRLFYIVNDRGNLAKLGHVAPHDLRRTAAGILHRATDELGAHHFDLLDIQRVLGHSDPATTMRSYLEPMQTEVLHRAALFLD